MFCGDSSKLGKELKSSSLKKVHFKNTVVAFIIDGIDFWKYKCKTEPLHTKEQSKKYCEKFNKNFDNSREDKHIKNKRKRKKK